MKKISTRLRSAGLASILAFIPAVEASITGQWDFNNGDLSATIGQPMDFLDADTQAGTVFGTTGAGVLAGVPAINGQPAKVMKFPVTAPVSGGYSVPAGAQANGGGGLVNQYTIMMDLFFPAASSGKKRALIQTDPSGSVDPQFFIDESNGIGFNGGSFDGNVTPDAWHRIALAVDAAASPPIVSKFIDGTKVGEDRLPAGVDGIFSIASQFYLFSDTTNRTQSGYLNSLQFSDEKLNDGLIAALGGATANGLLTGPPPNPYITSISPSPETAIFPGRSTVSPTPTIKITVEDGQSAVLSNSITLKIDSQPVTPSITKTGTTTTITFINAAVLPSLSIHTVSLSYSDNASPPHALGTQWDFAVGAYIGLPADAAQSPGPASVRGFVVRTAQAPADAFVQNNYLRALQQLDGTLLDTNGVPFVNMALPGPNPDGSYNVDDVIAFELNGNPLNAFPNTTTSPFPGIPGDDGVNTANFALEAVAYLDLKTGQYTFGVDVAIDRVDVQAGGDDDGYRLYVGPNPRDLFSNLAGQFARTGDNFNDRQNTNDFTVTVRKEGIYPFRLIYWQNGHGANLAWYSVDRATGEKILINDPNDPRAIKAYRVSSAPAASGPYVAEISPTPGAVGISPAAPIKILLIDGQTQVNTNSIRLSLNGAAAVPSITRVGKQTTVTLLPDAGRAQLTNLVHFVFSDASGQSETNDWQFVVTAGGAGNLTPVTGQWDFDRGDLSATVGQALEFFDGTSGESATKTKFGTTTEFQIPDIDGQPAKVMLVPGDISNKIGYTMRHGISPNGGGTRVNQYTLTMDLFIAGTGGSAASLIQINSLDNTDDGDLFWQNNNVGQGQGGYNGLGTFTPGAWHRLTLAVDLAANPPVIAKFVDGIKQEDWVQQGLDQDRRALKAFSILFADGDNDDRRLLYVNSVQIRSGKLSDAQIVAMGGPSASGVPVFVNIEAPGGELPALRIARNGDSVVVSWAAGVSGVTLESAGQVPSSTWTAVPGVVNNSVTVQPSGKAQFFRLRK